MLKNIIQSVFFFVAKGAFDVYEEQLKSFLEMFITQINLVKFDFPSIFCWV